MSTFVAFVLGVLLGWIVEWIIDWVYWRRRSSEALKQADLLRARINEYESRTADLEHQLAIQKVNLTSLQEKLSAAEASLVEIPAAAPVRAAPIMRDDLEIINGIGPVIAGKLNQVGVYSFADLAALTPERLRALVGDMISRLSDEESIISQAKQMAEQSRGG